MLSKNCMNLYQGDDSHVKSQAKKEDLFKIFIDEKTTSLQNHPFLCVCWMII